VLNFNEAYLNETKKYGVKVMVFKATFNNMSAIS